jgi:hypothetical protein
MTSKIVHYHKRKPTEIYAHTIQLASVKGVNKAWGWGGVR